MSTIQPQIKESHELEQTEIDQMKAIYRAIDPNLPEDHIVRNHIEKTQPIFYLFKSGKTLKAFQAFTFRKCMTPFSERILPVFYINISFKHPHAGPELKNFAKESNLHFLRHKLGKLWYTRSFVNVIGTYNPRLVHRLSQSFPRTYPNVVGPTPASVCEFAIDFFQHEFQMPEMTFNSSLVSQDPYERPTDITSIWSSAYQAKDGRYNQLFIKEGVILHEGGKYFLSGKKMLFIGHYSPWGALQHRLGLSE